MYNDQYAQPVQNQGYMNQMVQGVENVGATVYADIGQGVNYVSGGTAAVVDDVGQLIAQKKSNTLSEAEFIETAQEEKTKLFRRILIFAFLAAGIAVGTFLIFLPVMKLTGDSVNGQ